MKLCFRLFLVSVCFLEACDKVSDRRLDVESDSFLEPLTKSFGVNAVFDENSGFYLVPNKDVFELSNVQREYERLTGSIERLRPTHRAIKILPQDEETSHSLLSDSTMWVSRIPFGWRPIAQKVITDQIFDKYEPKEQCLTDVCFDEGTPPIISPLYARWPIEIAIPHDLAYEDLYDIYTPCRKTMKDSLLSLALYNPEPPRIERPDGGTSPFWHLEIKSFDNTFNTYKVVKNARVTYRDYSNYYTRTLTTDSFGMVKVPEDAPMSCTVFLDLYTDEFRVTSDSNSNYISLLVYPLSWLAAMPYASHMGIPTTTFEFPYIFCLQVFKAANYYYKEHNDLLDNINKLVLNTPLRIATYSDSLSITHNNTEGLAWFIANNNPPYIEIARFSNISGKIFGATLHELGHASHYIEQGALTFAMTSPMIKESFASLMGWYNIKKYYSSVLANDAEVHSIYFDGRQYWMGDNNDSYTPIYIDLVDNYNQSIELGSSYVNDAISGVPIEDVLSLAIGPITWIGARYSMQQQVGVLYSSTDFNNLMSLYPLL